MNTLTIAQDISWTGAAELLILDDKENKHLRLDNSFVTSSPVSNNKIIPQYQGASCRQSTMNYLRARLNEINNLVRAKNSSYVISSLPAAKVNDDVLFTNGSMQIATYGYSSGAGVAISNPAVFIPLLDLLVGNTLVILDQKNNEANRERRKHTGFAGDFEMVGGQFKYKVPSNFWFNHPILFSLVMGLTRLASNIAAQNGSSPSNNYSKAFSDLVARDRVIAAINENDAELALNNFSKITGLIEEITRDCYNFYPLARGQTKEFSHFLKEGVDFWFKGNLISNWNDNYNTNGAEYFLQSIVRNDMNNRINRLEAKTCQDVWA